MLRHAQEQGRLSFVEDDVLNAVVDWEQFDTLPTAVIEDEESKAIINHVLMDSLSEVQYQTIFMHYFNDMSVDDIAAEMECSSGTVNTRLMSARSKFKNALEGYLEKNKIVVAAATAASAGASSATGMEFAWLCG